MVGEYDNAVAAALRAREQYPEVWTVFSQLIRSQAAAGLIQGVWRSLDEAATLSPEAGRLFGELPFYAGLEFDAHGYPEAAQQAYQRAMDWFESQSAGEAESPTHRLYRGRTLMGLGRWADAEELLAGLVAEFPGRAEYLGWLGVIAACHSSHPTPRHLHKNLHTTWVAVAIRRFGMILKPRIDFSQLQIDVLRLRIGVMKLQIDVLKLRIEVSQLRTGVSKLGIEVSKLRIRVSKLRIEILKPRIGVSRLQIDDPGRPIVDTARYTTTTYGELAGL